MSASRSASGTPVGSHHQPPQPQQSQSHHHQNPSRSEANRPNLHSKIPNILPHERVFPIQIGTELFKLSGASLSSDGLSVCLGIERLSHFKSKLTLWLCLAPSYFSQYFLCKLKRAEETGTDPSIAIQTLYIDRDPLTFRDISLHLQGYHVSPRDGTHFVRLFADAQFYSLPKLISQLYEESIFMSIGHREFQIPRDLFADPGNSPNFFSLGFAIFFSNPTDLFPGLDREGLIRPPSILPPSVPGRSAETFSELLHLLRGYPLHIQNEEHRASLLKDCRYFNFKGLEQRLIPHDRSFNQARARYEIVLRLEDILKSGTSIRPEPSSTTTNNNNPGLTPAPTPTPAWFVNYARPFVDDSPAELVLQIGGENTRIHFSPSSHALSFYQNHDSHNNHNPNTTSSTTTPARVEFFRDARTRITKLFEVIASKLNLPPTQPLGLLMATGGAASQPASPGNTPLSEQDWVRCVLTDETSVVLDGERYTGHIANNTTLLLNTNGDGGGNAEEINIDVDADADADADEDDVDVDIDAQDDNPKTATPTTADPNAIIDTSPAAFSGLSLMGHSHPRPHHPQSRKRRRLNTDPPTTSSSSRFPAVATQPQRPPTGHWILKQSQWRLRIQSAPGTKSGVECVLVAVKLDALAGEHARNEGRGFL